MEDAPLWYYLPILVAGAWPWVLFVVRGLRRPVSDGERLLWCWFLADVVALSLAGSKLATYMLPILPAVAALAAVAIARAPTPEHVERERRVAAVAAVVTAGVPLTAMVALSVLAGWPVLSASSAIWAAAPVGVFALTRITPRRVASGPAQLLLVTASTLVAIALLVRPYVAERLNARDLRRPIQRRWCGPVQVWVVDEGIGSLVFYLRPDLRRALTARAVSNTSPRFSLVDRRSPPDAVMAVASDRVAGVSTVIDLAGVSRPAEGRFLVMPLTAVHLRHAAARRD